MAFVIAILILIICAMLYSVTESMRFKVTDYCVKHQKIPEELSGRRICLLSDLHCRSFGKDNEKLFNAIKKASPDLIIIAGDLVDGIDDTEFAYARKFLESITDLEIPVYYEFGNHETKFTLRAGDLYNKYIDLVNEYDVCLLRNASYDLLTADGSNISGARITGLEWELGLYRNRYLTGNERRDLNEILGLPDRSKYNILIAHTPEYEKLYYEWGADLVLSGHMHGGIIRLPFIGGLVSPTMRPFPHYDRGVFSDKDHTLILSAGLGWHGIPFRFYNLPEVVIISLEKE